MKNILFSIALAVSLVIGSSFAFAEPTAPHSGDKQIKMNSQELKKGLDEAIVVGNGKDSWVLHQPKENPTRYFLPTSEEKMAGESSGDTDSHQG